MNEYVEKELTQKEIIYSDPALRAGLHGVAIPGKQGRLVGRLFTAGGPGPHPAVLLCHGIPGTELNLDLARHLQRQGWHVLSFHYSGCWGSDGDYSFTSDLEDGRTALRWLLEDETYGVDKKHVYVVGHSVGGFVAGHLLMEFPELTGGVLLMPMDLGEVAEVEGKHPEAFEKVRALMNESAAWLHGCTGEGLLQEVLDKEIEFSLTDKADLLIDKDIMVVDASRDDVVPAPLYIDPFCDAIHSYHHKKLLRVCFNTDHSFNDQRLGVCDAVANFLKSML